MPDTCDSFTPPLQLAAQSRESAIRCAAAAFEAAGLHYGHGTDNAIDEAAWLIAHALGESPLDEPDYSATLSRHQLEHINALLKRRILERIPAAYLTGSTWFAGIEFRADARALVPRSPLAEWIVDDFYGMAEPRPQGRPTRLLDLCTGGGCIALAAALHHPDIDVVGSDLSAEALALARCNRALHQLQSRVELLQGDLFEPISGRFDIIVSNPPYVDQRDIDAMGQEFEHEPLMGLAAGEDGLDIVRRMLAEAKPYLHQQGWLVVEVGNSAEALEGAFPQLPFEWLEFSIGGGGVFALPASALSEPRK